MREEIRQYVNRYVYLNKYVSKFSMVFVINYNSTHIREDITFYRKYDIGIGLTTNVKSIMDNL